MQKKGLFNVDIFLCKPKITNWSKNYGQEMQVKLYHYDIRN